MPKAEAGSAAPAQAPRTAVILGAIMRSCALAVRLRRMVHLLAFTMLALYAGSFVCYALNLRAPSRWIGHTASFLLAAGIVAQYFALYERSVALHAVPYDDLYGSMSLFAWLLALTYLGLELFHRQRSVGAFVLPFILVFFVAAHLAPADRLSPPPAKGIVFAFHVTLSILAYAA